MHHAHCFSPATIVRTLHLRLQPIRIAIVTTPATSRDMPRLAEVAVIQKFVHLVDWKIVKPDPLVSMPCKIEKFDDLAALQHKMSTRVRFTRDSFSAQICVHTNAYGGCCVAHSLWVLAP